MNRKYRSYDELPLVLSVPQVAEILEIGKNTAYDLVRCGEIRSIRIGRQIKIPKDALIELLQKRDY